MPQRKYVVDAGYLNKDGAGFFRSCTDRQRQGITGVHCVIFAIELQHNAEHGIIATRDIDRIIIDLQHFLPP